MAASISLAASQNGKPARKKTEVEVEQVPQFSVTPEKKKKKSGELLEEKSKKQISTNAKETQTSMELTSFLPVAEAQDPGQEAKISTPVEN